jgi:outer membrane protein
MKSREEDFMSIIGKTATIAAVIGLLVFAPAAAEAKSAGDILVRLRGLAFMPDVDGTTDALGGSVEADDTFIPEVDFSYFFTDNIAVELIAAVTHHDMSLQSPDLDLGDVWLLPPTLTLQYHFMPKAKFSPYIGAGVNWTLFFNRDKSTDITAINYTNSFGPAFQVGLDMAVTDRWSLNLDVKKVFVQTDVKVNGTINAKDVDLDPWIVGFGFGYRF